MIALHPEAVPGRTRELRWVLPVGTLPFVGVPAEVPAVLAPLLGDGTVEAVEVEPTAVRTTLAEGRSWRREGDRVRRALTEALDDPAGWKPPAGASPDDVLRAAVVEVLAGPVGDYVRSHGGEVTLLSAADRRVEVALSGACAHCPAFELTLSGRVEAAVRARCPDVREVVAVEAPLETRRRPLLLPLRRTRRSGEGT